MARTVGIDFKFSGDATKAVAAFKQIAAAASAAGGDTAKAGKELERALRKAEEQASASARQAVAQTLAEADRNAASLKFEVGPPPRNMTKGRGADPLSGS